MGGVAVAAIGLLGRGGTPPHDPLAATLIGTAAIGGFLLAVALVFVLMLGVKAIVDAHDARARRRRSRPTVAALRALEREPQP